MADTKKTILHADDVLGWREYVRALLCDKYNVEFAVDFESTLERLARGGIDLLILDHLMPGTGPQDDAVAVCAHLRQRQSEVPIIIFTGALADSPMTREEFEQKVGEPVVLKEDVESDRADLRAQVDEFLQE